MRKQIIPKRLMAGLMTLVILLTLLPTAVFAEEITEDAPLCTCETVCTAESLNADCPVCGAEGAAETDCGLYTAPEADPAEPAETSETPDTPAEPEPEPDPDPEPTTEPTVEPEPEPEPEPTEEPEPEPETPVVPVTPATPTEPEDYVPTEPQDAATVQVMIDALPDAEDVANMTAEELEAAYLETSEVYALFELLNAEDMQTITGVEKIAALMDALAAASVALASETTTSQHDDYFYYENNSDGTGFIIVGLTETGKNAGTLTVPDTFTGDVTVTVKNAEGTENNQTTEDVELPVTELKGVSIVSSSLTAATLSESLDYMGLWVFDSDKKLETVTFQGRYPLKDFGLGGFENYLTFEGVNRDCTVYVPQPDSQKEYNNVLDSVYSTNRGAASQTVRLLWLGSDEDDAKSVPEAPTVTSESLLDLNTGKNKTELEKVGITIKTDATASDIECAAVITVKKGSGTKATLKAELPEGEEGSVYWITVEAYTGNAASITAVGGVNLTRGMYDYVYRRSSGSPTISLDTTGKKGRTVFYFPIATNYGDQDTPERSTVGQPVKVMYVADNAQPSIASSCNVVYYTNGQYENIKSMPTDTGYIKSADGAAKEITDAYEAYAPNMLYGYADAENASIPNTDMRATVIVPGFEALLPSGTELVANETSAMNTYNESRSAISGTSHTKRIRNLRIIP